MNDLIPMRIRAVVAASALHKVGESSTLRAGEESSQLRELVPERVYELFASAGIISPKEGEKVPLVKIDAALDGMSIDERMSIKANLRQAGLI
ncbi:MAG: hypothetical protein P8Z80_21200 [Pseudolabrys sp.]